MGMKHMVAVFEHSEAEHGPRLVMLALAEFANDRDVSYPSVATLGGHARLSDRAVQTALRKLTELGEIVQLDGLSSHGTRQYRLELGGADSAGGVQNVVENTTNSAPEPTTKPTTSTTTSGAESGATLFEVPAEAEPDPVAQVWAHYQATVAGADRRTLDSTRTTCIKRALGVRNVDECCRAIDGLAASPHHNGDNDQKRKYLEIEYALGRKSDSPDSRIDTAIGWAERYAGAETTTARDEFFRKLTAAQREELSLLVRRAAQSKSDHASEREIGESATAKLRSMGVELVWRDGKAVDWTYGRQEAA